MAGPFLETAIPATIDMQVAQIANSFGLRFNICDCGCHAPPSISLALGVNGEIDAPAVIHLDLAQADELIDRLQSVVTNARKAGLN